MKRTTKTFIQTLISLATILLLAACAAGESAPTPTIVPLDRSQLSTADGETAAAPPTATPIPPPSPTPTFTPFALTDLAATATPTASVEAETGSTPSPVGVAQLEVTTTGLYLRSGPGLDYPTAGGASAGDRFEVTGINPTGHWFQINSPPSGTAWISAKADYVRLVEGARGEVPIIGGPTVGVTPAASRTGLSAPVGAASPAPASPPSATGLSGQLIFATSSGGDLYAINADGSNLRLLTRGVIDPVIAPDGRQVAFTRWDGAEFGTLYTIDSDGSNERAIVGDIRQPKSPTWSPDGQQIIISFQHGGLRDPEEECRQFDFDDGFRLPDDIGQITSFQTTSDGTTVCFIRKEDLRWALRQVEVATGEFEDLEADEYSFNPAWDPNQPWRVIYDGNDGLMQLDLNRETMWPLTDDLRDTGPVFAPDGERLALTYKQHDHWEVYTLDPASGARQRLTKPPILADPQYNSAAPAWSPDGQHLAFFTDRSGDWEIWVMEADGSNLRPLFPPEVQAQLPLDYHGVNERLLNWVE